MTDVRRFDPGEGIAVEDSPSLQRLRVKVARAVVAFLDELTDNTRGDRGAAMVAFNAALTYPGGTVGKALKDLIANGGGGGGTSPWDNLGELLEDLEGEIGLPQLTTLLQTTIADLETTVAGLQATYGTTTDAAASAAAAAAAEAAAVQAQVDALAAANLADVRAGDALDSADAAETAKVAAQTAQATASTQATNAANSATSAAGSASSASSSATTASNAATAAGNSASAASTSASQASTSATNAGTSASAAQTARTQAETAASNASTSANNAASSATTAQGAASTATTQAQTAATAATNAQNSATAAAGSATTATARASEAASSASAANTSRTQAQTARDDAQTAASQASTSATNAAGSASTAGTSASNAATSAGNAAGSASAASSSASSASTSATNAADSASAAATSATAANNSKLSAEASALAATNALAEQGRFNLVSRSGADAGGPDAVDLSWGVSGWGFRAIGTGANLTIGQIADLNLENNVAYSVSFQARLTAGSSQILAIAFVDENTTPSTTRTVTSTAQRFTWENVSASDLSNDQLRFRAQPLPAGVTIEITDIKVEKGATATAFTPSPKDARDYVAAAVTQASTAQAHASAAASSASAADTAKVAAQTAQSAASSLAGAAATAATNAESSATAAASAYTDTVAATGALTAQVTSLQDAVAGPDGVTAQYVFKVAATRTDGKKVFAAIGLAATANDAAGESQMLLQADKLLFVPPGNPNATPIAALEVGLVNGVTTLRVPAARIGDATIDTINMKGQSITADVKTTVVEGTSTSGGTSSLVRLMESGLTLFKQGRIDTLGNIKVRVVLNTTNARWIRVRIIPILVNSSGTIVQTGETLEDSFYAVPTSGASSYYSAGVPYTFKDMPANVSYRVRYSVTVQCYASNSQLQNNLTLFGLGGIVQLINQKV